MDIHRCRFVPYQPSSITALAFSHSSNPTQKTPTDLKLALGRETGDIEIWNPRRGRWHQERIYRGSIQRTVEQLQWTQNITAEEDEEQKQKFQNGPLRLFSSGGSPSIIEWDLEKGKPKREVNGNKGDIWCIAVQPQWTPTQLKEQIEEVRKDPAQKIAAGCSDGSIVLFSTAEDDLQFDRILVHPLVKKSKVISLTWRDRDTIVAGYDESTIRVIDIRSRRVLRNITLGKSSDGDPALVWTVKCLPNGTILSGDSTGELKIWDAHNYSLVQRLKTHSADVLDITVNAAGTTILTCSVDRRTVAYAPRSDTSKSLTQRWHEVRHRRFHEHDVKALASFESKDLSIAVSGGVDTIPVVLPLRNWDEDYHRSLPYLPQQPQMSVSPKSRLMLSWWGRDLFLWNLPSKRYEHTGTESVSDEQVIHKLLAQIQLKEDEFLNSAELSRSGEMVIAATSAGVKLFQIRKTTSREGEVEVRFRPFELPSMIATQGASKVGFSPDCKWLYTVRLNDVVTLANISPAPSAKERPTVLSGVTKLDRKHRRFAALTKPTLGEYARHINAVTFSSDSRSLAVGDISGAVDTWVLEAQESAAGQNGYDKMQVDRFGSDANSDSDSDSESDSDDETSSVPIHGQRWILTPAGSQLPQLDSAILVLSFKPTLDVSSRANEDLTHFPTAESLVAITSSHQVIEFDVQQCRISDWSRRNPSELFPASFRQIKDRVMGAWWDYTLDHERFWMYGEGFVYMIDRSQDIDPSEEGRKHGRKKIGMLGRHVVEAPQGHPLTRLDDAQQPKGKALSKKRKRKNGGAGDEMRQEQKYSVKLQRLEDHIDQAGLLSPPQSVAEDGNNDDEHENIETDDDPRPADDPLVTSRRKEKQQQPMQSDRRHKEVILNGDGNEEESEEDDDGGACVDDEDVASKPTSWHTFQYRGIFGACVLEARSHGNEESEAETDVPGIRPEIVIVERPMHDIEFIPRFTNGQDW